jgi:hypothetical protein
MIEALAILVPLPLMFVVLGTLSIATALSVLPLGLVSIAATATLISAYLSTSKAMLSFIYGGSSGLVSLRKFWWLPGVLSVVAAPIATAVVVNSLGASDEAALMMTVLLLGVPLLVPIVHLLLEAQLRPNAKQNP